MVLGVERMDGLIQGKFAGRQEKVRLRIRIIRKISGVPSAKASAASTERCIYAQKADKQAVYLLGRYPV